MLGARIILLVLAVVAGTTSPAFLWMALVTDLGAQETNRVPEFREGSSAIRVVAEGTPSDEDIGEPVVAVDPGDTLTYSLTGHDADQFDIDTSTGQILTKGELDYSTKGSYSVTVNVTDGTDDAGEPDSIIDDTIEITIRVSVAVDLNDWISEDYDSNTQYCASGAWTVDSQERAKETGGQAPSVLHGNFDAYGKRLRAKVNPGGDDDFFGFVVGFNGGDSSNANADYLLIDWKKQSQSFNFGGDSTSPGGNAETGLRLSRVKGIPDCDEFWQHANLDGTPENSGVEELQEGNTKGSVRYNPQDYEFTIDFGPENIQVYLDGRLELDLEGEFGEGKFGAYAMLHNSAVFWDFSYTDGSFPSNNEAVDQPGEVTLSSTQAEVGVALTATLTDLDGEVTNEVWQWESSPNEVPRTWTAISGANASSYIPVHADAGKVLRATVVYDDAGGTSRTAFSASTMALDRAGALRLSPGNPVVGEAVTATLHDEDGGVASEVWEWESSADEDPLDWSVIDGADTATYVPQTGDAGRLLRVRVEYDDAAGTGKRAVSEATAAVDQRGEVTVSPGVPVVGEVVTATLTDADGDVTGREWKWERSPGTGELEWSVIDGADSSEYRPVAADDAGKRLRAAVSYSDGTGSGRSAVSGPTERVDRRGVVALTTGVPDVGITMMATLADADGPVTGEVWQWQWSPSSGALAWSDIAVDSDGASYTPVANDEGKLLRVTASYDDSIGSGRSVVSVATAKVGKAGMVSLSSTEAAVGEGLTVTLEDADGSVSNLVWRWESALGQGDPEWSPIMEAISADYIPVVGDAGRLLRVRVEYTDSSGDGRVAWSGATERVDQRGSVTVAPDPPVVGSPVRATLNDADGGFQNQSWQWERSPHGPQEELEWTEVSGAQLDRYTPTASDSGKLLRVSVKYDDGTGTGRSATSVATQRVDQEGAVGISPSPPVAGEVVQATLADADGGVTGEVWKWERSQRTDTREWEEIAGADSASYTPNVGDDGGKLLRVTVEYNDAIGTGRVATSASTLPVDRPGVVVLTTNAPLVGREVTATLMDGDGGILNEAWEWESSPDQETLSWSPIASVESRKYEPTVAVAGRVLRAKVTYDDETGRGREAVSAATVAVDQAGILSLSTGNPVVGEPVTATLSDADGGVEDESWEWESSADQDPQNWIVVQGADTAKYVPTADTAGRIVRARVTYNDGVGTGRSATSSATEAVDQRGALTLLPKTPVVGEMVEAVLTDADGDVSEVVWKWERSPGVDEPVWSDINGAASSSYTPVAPEDAGHILRVTVTYTDGVSGGRSATATTINRVDQRGEAILSTIVPDLGMAVMATLVDSDGGVTGASWQWQSSPSTATVAWSDIAGATASAYTVTTADAGALLRVTVGYHDAVGNDRNAVSVASQKVGKPGNVNLDSSMPVVGEMISATLTDADGSTSNEEWQWETSPAQENSEWKPIADADSADYMPVAGNAGLLLRATVVYTDDTGIGRMARSTATAKVDTTGTVTVSPNPPVVGKPAKATLTDADGSITNQVWKWERSLGTGEPEWTPISGAHSSSYKPAEDEDSGKLLRVVVTYDDGTGTDRSASSLATERVDRSGVVTVSPSPPVAGKPVTATLTDADGSIANQVWKWERSSRMGTSVWTEISGATAASYTPLAADDGAKILRATVSYDDGIGTGRIATSASTLAVDRPGVISLSTTMPVVGEKVTATLVDEDGGLLNEEWQWESSPEQETPEWTEVTGAETSTYTPAASLAGRLVRVVVRYDDATGRGREAASDSTAPLDQRGVVTLSSMAPVVGQAVTATLTDADGSIANEDWAWKSSQSGLVWESVPDADSATYTPMPGDAGRLLRVQVSYDDAIETGRNAISGATAAVDQRGLVTLSHSTPVAGEELTAVLTDADGDVSDEVWRWERSPGTGEPTWSEISGAASSGYTPTASSDAGQILRVVVTYTDGTGTGRSVTSAVTNRVDQRGMVTLNTNVPDVGVVVAATLADPDKGLTGQVWQWQSSPSTGTPSWSDVAGATASTYMPTTANEGSLLRVVVGYDDAIGSGRSLTSVSSDKVGKPGVVGLDSTTPVVGRAINATLADADGDVSNQVWKWESSLAQGNLDWLPISGADSAGYTPVAEDAGRLLRMTVTYTDDSGNGRRASSSPTATVDQLGTLVVKSRSAVATIPEVGVWQDAVLNDPDGMVSSQVWRWEISPFSPQDTRTWTPIEGADSRNYKPISNDAGKVLRVVVTYSDGSGTNRETTSPATERVDQPGTIELSSYSDVVVGGALTAALTDADGGVVNAVWNWHRSPNQDEPKWTVIEGGASQTYTPTEGDGGLILMVMATYDDAIGTGRSVASASTGVVDRPGIVTLSTYTPESGEPIEASLEDGDGGERNVRWRWESSPAGDKPNWKAIPQAPELASYTLPSSLAGVLLRAVVNYDDANAGRMAASDATKVVGQPGVVTLDSAEPVTGVEVTAVLTDLDGGVTGDEWRWQSSPDQLPRSWRNIPNANSNTYAPVAGDAGMLLKAIVSYADPIAAGRTAESAETGAVDQPGVVSLSTVEPEVGQVVRAMLEDPDGGLTGEKWGWQKSAGEDVADWESIVGSNANTYEPVSGDAGYRLRAVVTYGDIRKAGRVAVSDPTLPVYQRGAVALSPDRPIVGEPVIARFSHPDSNPEEYSWLWESSPGMGEPVWSAIQEATARAYTPVPADAGRLLRATVTYRDENGTSRSETSPPSARVDQRGLVELTPETPVVGEMVTALLSDPDGHVTNRVWQWERSASGSAHSWSVIDGAVSPGYVPATPEDVGKMLRVRVSYDDGTGTARIATSVPTNRVDRRGVVRLSTRVPDVGVPLTATLSDPDHPVRNVLWQWQRSSGEYGFSWADIIGESGATYTPVTDDEEAILRVVAVYDDASNMGRYAESVATDKVGKAGAVTLDSEIPMVGEPVTAMLVDPDGTVSNVVWQWENAASGAQLTWRGIAGASLVTYTPVTKDIGLMLRATATYDDKTGVGRKAASKPVGPVEPELAVQSAIAETVPEISKYNFAPAFREGEITERKIALGWAGAKAGAPVTATDQERDGLTYVLTGEGSAFFKVDPGTGQVSIDDGLVFLWPGTYHVMLHAIDSEGGMGSIAVRITVYQFSVPVFQESDRAIRRVLENLPPGALVGPPVRARDFDGDIPVYSLSGYDGDAFELNTVTGQISTRRALDREGRSKYEVILRAEDGRGGYDFIQVDIEVVDENEPPVLNDVPSGLVIDEDSVIGTPIGTPIGARDPEQDPLSYSLSGVEANGFGIDQKTGQLVTTGILDYETRPDYRFIARVEDGRGGSDEITVTVGVADVNDAPSFGPKRVVELAVPENSPVGAIVGGPLRAKDPEDDRLVYSLSGDGVGAFDIDAVEGLVVSKATLDYESRTSYLVQVSAVDGGGRSDSIYVSILVTDVEEQASDPDKGDVIAELMTSSSPSSASADSQLGSTADGAATGPHSDYGYGLDPDVGQSPAGPSAYGEPVSTSVPVGEKESYPIPVSSMPHHSPSTRDRADAAESTVVLGNNVDENVLPTSPTGSLAILLSNNAPAVPDQMPLWLVLALLVLPYIDGILLIILLYRR